MGWHSFRVSLLIESDTGIVAPECSPRCVRAESMLASRDLRFNIPVSQRTLAGLRLVVGALMLHLILERIVAGPSATYCYKHGGGWGQRYEALQREPSCIPYGGHWLFSTFTVWCWTCKAIYFVMAGALGLYYRPGTKGPWSKALAFGLWIFFEVLLTVAVVVTFVVWLGR
jgi:hypothetical protein